ncbi:hypothetical protein Tco_0407751 [Tanacetum coccineum]
MLYGRRYRTPVCWEEVGSRELVSTDVVLATIEKIETIHERLKAEQDRWKSYADNRRRPIEFNVRDFVMLKVSPWKGVLRFKNKIKLSLRFIGSFKILKRIGEELIINLLRRTNDNSRKEIKITSQQGNLIGEGRIEASKRFELVPLSLTSFMMSLCMSIENDEKDDEEVENVYDESANLVPNANTIGSSSFMAAAVVLAVLITKASQSRQHGKSEPDLSSHLPQSLFDVGSGRISIVIVNTLVSL